jgi:hypothetical protein
METDELKKREVEEGMRMKGLRNSQCRGLGWNSFSVFNTNRDTNIQGIVHVVFCLGNQIRNFW